MMANRRVDICNPNENTSQKDKDDDRNIDWDLCFICQEKDHTPLQNPIQNPCKQETPQSRYNKLAGNNFLDFYH